VQFPDGIAVDVAAGHILTGHMGVPKVQTTAPSSGLTSTANRIDNAFPQGGIYSQADFQLEKKSEKLYCATAKACACMRANLDGSKLEDLVDASQGDSATGAGCTKWCVGVARRCRCGKLPLDAERVPITRARAAFARRASTFTGQDRRRLIVCRNRSFLLRWLPEPIDLDLDRTNRVMY